MHGITRLVMRMGCASLLLAGGCSGSSGSTAGFVSDDPGGSSSSGGGALSGPNASADGQDERAGEAGRAIEEADIVRLDGSRLYALSRHGGLSIIDVSVRDRLTLLGNIKMVATPFEMYLRDNVVIALLSDWGQYVESGDSWQWVQTSRVVAIDVSDPHHPEVRGHFTIPGAVSDSRIVGDVLYVVAHEDGYCYNCAENSPRTTVASLDVKNPASIGKVDQLAFADANDQWGWGPRSITVTPERMYVAGREHDRNGNIGSTIQVVDISDLSGTLRLGAAVEAEGEIRSRWQMDEHEGVLRVISQPWTWRLDTPPVVQTFAIESSNALSPLGRVPLVLPRPEELQSVRFDGTRAYAITFERTDPLFTIDLSNPAAPVQRGELEMPGFVYHMEPRGDRLIGLGFDQESGVGSLHVSLFDVSNLDEPKMLDRENFGGDWGYLPEQQNQIHKAFRVLDDAGLILVPFSGFMHRDSECYGEYRSGIQLLDLAGDDLIRRGVAPSRGDARRAFLHDTRLFAMSDERVQVFDIEDRSSPVETAQTRLARNVSRTAVAGDSVVRIAQDWWTSGTEIDVVPLSQVEAYESTATLDVSNVLDGEACDGYAYLSGAYGGEGRAYLTYQSYDYRRDEVSLSVATVSVEDPANPTLLGNATVFEGGNEYYDYYGGQAVAGTHVHRALAGTTLVQLGGVGGWHETSGQYRLDSVFADIADLTRPDSPATTRLELPFKRGLNGLHVDGATLLTSHYEPVPGDASRVRFYMDRIDVSRPSAPRLSESVNIPGSLLAWDAATKRAVTVDYHRRVQQNLTANACYTEHGYSAHFEPSDPHWQNGEPNPKGSCTVVSHSLKLVKLDGGTASLEATYAIGEGKGRVASAALGEDRLFVLLGNEGYYYHGWAAAVDCYGRCYGYGGETTLLVASGLHSGRLDVKRLTIANHARQIVACGTRALAAGGGTHLIDASGVTPTVTSLDVPGYVSDVTLAGSTALLSLAHDGVRAVELGD